MNVKIVQTEYQIGDFITVALPFSKTFAALLQKNQMDTMIRQSEQECLV